MDLRLTRRVIPLLQYMYDVPCTTLNIYLHWDGSHQMELRHELFIETETNWKIITNLSQTNDFHIRNTVEHGLLFDYCSVALRARWLAYNLVYNLTYSKRSNSVIENYF